MMELPLYDDAIGSVSLIESWGNDATPAHSARVSFLNDQWCADTAPNDRDTRLIRYLAEHRHTSPFEHLGATLRITAPLFVARQIMRHRTFSFNEVSRRYSSESVEIWRPTSLRAQSQTSLQCSAEGEVEGELDLIHKIDASIDLALDTYHELIEQNVAREIARAVLPCSIYTTWWQSGNLHAWAHLLRLRLDAHAQPETQELAEGVAQILRSIFPVSLGALLQSN